VPQLPVNAAFDQGCRRRRPRSSAAAAAADHASRGRSAPPCALNCSVDHLRCGHARTKGWAGGADRPARAAWAFRRSAASPGGLPGNPPFAIVDFVPEFI
jgi:hypothetical protein